MPEEPAASATGAEGQPPAAPAATAPTVPAPSPVPAEPEPKPTETVDFWKTQARENEKRAKSNAGAAKELEKLKASMMSDTEKAVEAARAEGRKEATTATGRKLAAAEAKAALTGVVANPAEIVEDLDLTKYITDDGDVDAAAIAKLRKKYEALSPTPSPGQRPKERMRTVPLAANGTADKTDMNAWMREQASARPSR